MCSPLAVMILSCVPAAVDVTVVKLGTPAMSVRDSLLLPAPVLIGALCAALQLSPECTDLLNRIFVIDYKKRIRGPENMEHAWYNRPLLPRYEAAEADIARRQSDVEAYIRRRDLNIVRACPPLLLPPLGYPRS